MAAEFSEGYVKVNGINMHYTEWGSGDQDIILLHGWTGWARQWDDIARALKDDYHVVCPEQRGHGDTDKPATGYLLSDFAKDLHEFIQAKGLRKPLLSGHSWGGSVGVVAAANYPDDLGKLVAEDPVLSWRMRIAAEQSLPRMRERKQLSRADLEASIRQQDPAATEEQVELRVQAALKYSVDALTRTLTDNRPYVFENDLARIQIPTIILAGVLENGGSIPAEEAEQTRKLLKKGKVYVYPDTGHVFHRGAKMGELIGVIKGFAAA